MLTRIISGVVMAAVITASIFFSPYPFGVLLLICSLIAVFELSKAIGVHTEGKKINALEVVMYLATIAIYVLITTQYYDVVDQWTMGLLVAAFLALMGIFVFTFPKYTTSKVVKALAIIMYAPLMLSFGYRIRLYAEHPYIMTGLIFLVACGSDIFAYFVGSAIGKHKLAPKLSPKKSIEGAVGAIILTGVCCAVYAIAFNRNGYIGEEYVVIIAIMGALGSIISQIGDLMASAIKRNYNIKDYGKLIPGHGGIMDRVDSWLVVMPIIYILLIFVNGLY